MDVCFRYKSSSLEVPTPIVAFGFQEPCNDPQNFCYLWVLYESDPKLRSCLPFAVMHGILYKRVHSVPGFGRHYRVSVVENTVDEFTFETNNGQNWVGSNNQCTVILYHKTI